MKLDVLFILTSMLWLFFNVLIVLISYSAAYLENVTTYWIIFLILTSPMWFVPIWGNAHHKLGRYAQYIFIIYFIISILSLIIASIIDESPIAISSALIFVGGILVFLSLVRLPLSTMFKLKNLNNLKRKLLNIKCLLAFSAVLILAAGLSFIISEVKTKYRPNLEVTQEEIDAAVDNLLGSKYYQPAAERWKKPSYSETDKLQAMQLQDIEGYYYSDLTKLQKNNLENESLGKIILDKAEVIDVVKKNNSKYNVSMARVLLSHPPEGSTYRSLIISFSLPVNNASDLRKGSSVSFVGRVDEMDNSSAKSLKLFDVEILEN